MTSVFSPPSVFHRSHSLLPESASQSSFHRSLQVTYALFLIYQTDLPQLLYCSRKIFGGANPDPAVLRYCQVEFAGAGIRTSVDDQQRSVSDTALCPNKSYSRQKFGKKPQNSLAIILQIACPAAADTDLRNLFFRSCVFGRNHIEPSASVFDCCTVLSKTLLNSQIFL